VADLNDKMRGHVEKLIDGFAAAVAHMPDEFERELIGKVGVDSAMQIVRLQAEMRPYMTKEGADLRPLLDLLGSYTNEIARAIGAYVLKTTVEKAKEN